MDSDLVELADFIERVTRVPAGIRDDLARIQPLLEKNRGAIALDFSSAEFSLAKNRAALKEAHENLRRFADLHPGLDLHGIFATEPDPGKAAQQAKERVGWLRTVFALNPDVDFLNLEYLPDSPDLAQVQFGTLSEEARQRVLQELKTHKRIQAVANNALTEYERYLAILKLAKGPDTISNDIGIDRQHIAWMVHAAACEEKSKGLNPSIRTSVPKDYIPQAVFYGWFRQGIPTDWESLRSQSTATLREALLDAIRQNIIRRDACGDIESILASVASSGSPLHAVTRNTKT